MRNATGFDDVPEQVEVRKIEAHGGGYLLILRRQATQKAYCNGLFSGPSFVNYEVATWGSRSRGMFAHPHLRLPVRLSCNAPGRLFSEADDGRVSARDSGGRRDAAASG